MSIPTFNLDLSSLIIIGSTAAIGGRFVAALLIPDMRPPNVGEVLLGVGFIGFYLFLQHLP